MTNCRYRPYDQLFDYYRGKKRNQTNDDYYIHPNWSDRLIKQFNRNVRRHNMSVRFRTRYHSRKVEKKMISSEMRVEVINMKYSEAIHHLDDAWNPSEFHDRES